MSSLDILQTNLLSVPVLCFGLGLMAVAIRSDLKIPPALYSALTIYLLFAIGLKGGVAVSQTALADLWLPLVACIAIGLFIPLWIYVVSRRVGRMGPADAGGLAAHYGSVSAVTFIACQTVLDLSDIPYEGFMPALMAVLEVPSIVVGLFLARRGMLALGGPSGSGAEERPASGAPADEDVPENGWGTLLHEVLTGRSILLLAGGIAIGWLAGPERAAAVDPLFVGPFQGVLALFMIEMGMLAARRLAGLRKAGPFVAVLGVVAAIVNGTIGGVVGLLSGLGPGGAALLATLAGSASYIAATAACRVALPEANPGIYLGASLGVTFPFNLAIGVPYFIWLTSTLAPALGSP
ncbi:MAG: sodium-dependent bicarbonate transport family permease [Deltaproteobacteria bacterium]|nr:MAG: sodium-dependent bicarbonate transport family permease [Deltaproteobacteria bacterium]